jgi:signal transduction histidine kinase
LAVKRPGQTNGHAGGRVLIVDDSEDDIEMIRRFLAADTIEIRGVTDSTQAERVFTEFEPDCVLLDLHMPPPDGLEILRRIRDARSRLGFLPVLVLTGDVGPVARNNALDLGADDFLTKPLDRKEVVLRVRNLLSTRRLHVELARAYRHKSEFLASMSHELRTQLSSVIGFSELLLSDTTERFDEPRRRKFLAQINSSGRYLLDLTSDILDLAKIESGHVTLRLETVMIVEIAHGVIRTMDPLAAKKAIRIKAELGAAGQVEADAGKLRQMLLNLVSNAVKFTPEGGRVTIGARRLDDTVEISVSDTGIGIAKSEFENLFEEFRQIDSDIAREQHGTGLGLALTKRFVELHGGQIRIASEVGKGSVFTLSLPLVRLNGKHSDLTLALEDISLRPANR